MIAALAIAVVVAGCASDDKPKPRRWNPNATSRSTSDWHSPTAMLLKYDVNHDGTLTRKELEAGLRKDFEVADKKQTGCLDSDEVTEINEERMKYDESAASPLIDWKNKGCVDFDAYATMARSLFMQLDTNNDGEISPNEFHPHAPRKKQPDLQLPPSGGGY